MTTRTVVLRQRAEQDIDDALDFYFAEGGHDLALRFVDALENAFAHIAAHPDSGSPRYSAELDIPQLRYWVVHAFQHLIFYIASANTVDVWRVLHGKQDIPKSLQGD